MRRPAPILCALAVILLLAGGCAGRSRAPAYEVPPLAAPGEDQPTDEISENLALALGAAASAPAPLERQRESLPKALVGDRQNADYSGERLIGSTARSVPAPEATPAAPQAVPQAVPRVAVARQPASPAQVPAAAKTAAAPAAPPMTAARGGQAIAQIAAFRTRAEAESGWQRLRAAYPDLLGDRALLLDETDLGTRGIYYRVRTGPFADSAAAAAFCERLRARDQECLVVNPN